MSHPIGELVAREVAKTIGWLSIVAFVVIAAAFVAGYCVGEL